MTTYSRNSTILDLRARSFQGVELRCPTSNCRQKTTIPIEQFADDLTLDIIHWTTSCSICGRADVYATPMLTCAQIEPPKGEAAASASPEIKRLIQSCVANLSQMYPNYVATRAAEISKDEFARDANRSWSDCTPSEQASIIRNKESEIREGHFVKAGKFVISVVVGVPAF